MGETGAPAVGPTSTLESGQMMENIDLWEEGKITKDRTTANRLLSIKDNFKTDLAYKMDQIYTLLKVPC